MAVSTCSRSGRLIQVSRKLPFGHISLLLVYGNCDWPVARSLANQGSSLLIPQYDGPVGLGNEWYNILLYREKVKLPLRKIKNVVKLL